MSSTSFADPQLPDLPQEMTQHILSFLPSYDVFWSAGLVNRNFFRLSMIELQTCDMVVELREQLPEFQNKLDRLLKWKEVVESIKHVAFMSYLNSILWESEESSIITQNVQSTIRSKYGQHSGVMLVCQVQRKRHEAYEPHVLPTRNISIQRIVDKCPYLEGLFFEEYSCYNLSDDDMKYIADKCTSMENIVLQNCESVTHKGIDAFTNSCKTLLRQQPSSRCSQMRNKVMPDAYQQSKRLRKLVKRYFRKIYSDARKHCVKKISQLKDRCLAKCHGIINDGMENILNCPKFSKLALKGCKVCIDRDADMVYCRVYHKTNNKRRNSILNFDQLEKMQLDWTPV